MRARQGGTSIPVKPASSDRIYRACDAHPRTTRMIPPARSPFVPVDSDASAVARLSAHDSVGKALGAPRPYHPY
eukprot:6219216-Pyramimonas_sp.AAC.1